MITKAITVYTVAFGVATLLVVVKTLWIVGLVSGQILNFLVVFLLLIVDTCDGVADHSMDRYHILEKKNQNSEN
jgi:hypothetical protein